jgi:hypothetical protein
MAEKVTLQDDIILESWSTIIMNAHGNADQLYTETEKLVEAIDIPGANIDNVIIRPSWLKGLFGVERKYMRVTNESLKDYRIIINARDYGKCLDISWYLTCEPGFFKKALSNALTKGEESKAISFNLDLFQRQDLSAFTTVVHRCVLNGVDQLMSKLGQDSSKIDRKSKGFLGIS